MSKLKPRYCGRRFPPAIISYAVWAYHRFTMSYRDVEDLLAERGVIVSYESVRRWCLKFGPRYRRALKRREGRLGEDWYCDEVHASINGEQHHLWRSSIMAATCWTFSCKAGVVEMRFFRKVLKAQGAEPRRVVTDDLRSYAPAIRDVLPTAKHDIDNVCKQPRGEFTPTHASPSLSNAPVQKSAAGATFLVCV